MDVKLGFDPNYPSIYPIDIREQLYILLCTHNLPRLGQFQVETQERGLKTLFYLSCNMSVFF